MPFKVIKSIPDLSVTLIVIISLDPIKLSQLSDLPEMCSLQKAVEMFKSRYLKNGTGTNVLSG